MLGLPGTGAVIGPGVDVATGVGGGTVVAARTVAGRGAGGGVLAAAGPAVAGIVETCVLALAPAPAPPSGGSASAGETPVMPGTGAASFSAPAGVAWRRWATGTPWAVRTRWAPWTPGAAGRDRAAERAATPGPETAWWEPTLLAMG